MNRFVVFGIVFGLGLGMVIILSARPDAPPAPSALADHRTLTTYPGP